MKLICTVVIFVLSFVCFAGHIGAKDALAIKYSLPQFGHYVTIHGAIREKLPTDRRIAQTYRLRSISELINEWHSPCLDKSGVMPVTKTDIQDWLNANYVQVDDKLQHISESQAIANLVSIVAYLACEYKNYGLDEKKFKTCIKLLNKLSQDKWTLRIFGGKLTIGTYRAKARKNYETGTTKIEREMRHLMIPLEEIHRKEFAKWAQNNNQQYAKLKRNDDELEKGILMQAKLDELTEATRRAEDAAAAAASRASAAEEAASAAASRAAAAASRARAAEDAANAARFHGNW